MELGDRQKLLLREASKTRGKGGYASKSAVRHLERALVLKDQMPEVSVFLAITAEEEAASAVFAALRKRNYIGADKLRDRDHNFKAGLYPFVQLVGKTVGAIKYKVPLEFYFQEKPENPSDGILRIRMPINLPGNETLYIVPDPPLNQVSVGPDGNKKDYFQAVRGVATEEGINSIYEHVRHLANRRNQVLYASNSEIPRVENIEECLESHIKGVFANLALYLLVEPHSKQNLVQEALTAFLKIQSRLEVRET